MEIKVNGLSKEIKGTVVLENINYTFTSGNIYGIVGKNGSGKTMLLREISGLIHPSAGYIEIDGKILHKDLSFPPSMGIIIEKPEFISHLSGLANLKMIAEVKKIATEETIRNYMRFFSLDPDLKQSVKRYSLGMRQKIGIIQAIMENPDLLVLDEPFNALDEESVKKLRELLLKFKEEQKLIIVTSHHKEDIDYICNQIINMENGKVSCCGR